VKVGERKHERLDLDSFYQSLGETEENRETACKDCLLESLPDDEMQLIREAAHRGQLTGDANFIDEVVVKTGRCIEFRGRGRPRRDKK